ncbi:type II toxin-antitoxin system RelE family toxin [Parapedobacter tibetensis]|uniref:type II toxin-antitoxin system RelE family toxin n=1 Tax=Parapedobacter tibetensis TaxID=2972951 RepID=UPI00214DB1BE|nr:type II toxin-antitoxin system RelE/ParE family toxin [Parapedobacter tibetensis]
MNFEIEISEAFRKAAKSLAKKHPSFKKDLTEFLEILAEKPTSGTPLGGGLYKVRMSISSKGKGKSGGARVIICVIFKHGKILLADIYDKSDFDTVDEKRIIKNLRSEGFDI